MEPKEYTKLRKKYRKLPAWDWVEKNFFFKPEEGLILVQIKRAIFEKFENIAEDMEPILAVGESLESFYERKMLAQKERDKLFEIYKNLQFFLWSCNKISVEYDEKEHANWIISAKKSWEKIKPEIAKFCEKLANGWKTYQKPEAETGYHG